VSKIGKLFGPDIILQDLSFKLEAREKVALVGRNGAGKTTLLKILAGHYQPDGGSVALARGAKVGYLRQEAPIEEGLTVLQAAESAVKHRLELQDRLAELEKVLEGSPTDADLEEYSLLHEHFLESEGYSAERDIKTVLERMGFEEPEFSKPTAKLSGGEKTRLALAKMLLEEPDLLILDEPTNHLDLQASEWLEGWVRAYHGAVLLVSHDRTFLQNTAERVLEMREGTVRSWPGPFEKYVQLRADEDARIAVVAKQQDQQIAKMDEYVRRFMNSQRTAQAKGRQKLMNRLIESKVEVAKADKGMKAGFGEAKRSGDIVLEFKGLDHAFGDETLFKNFDWTARYGERWGVIGENGAGKSTLLKIGLGLLEPTNGTVRLGSSVVAGYFSQDASDLDLDRSPIDMFVYDHDLLPEEARNLLGRFLISGDDVYRPIRTLSGGEKNKLSLARLTLLNPNLLVLDEPTNHLDMASRDALADVLADYKGTLILISHDRWLLGRTTLQTLDVRRSGSIEFPGSYDEYRLRQKSGKPIPSKKATPAVATITEPTLSPRELSKEIDRMTKVVASVEGEVAALEKAIADIEHSLATLPHGLDVNQASKDHHARKLELEKKIAEWEETCLRLDELSAKRG
jgi:ATP-binding cassette subfamily F protein 3